MHQAVPDAPPQWDHAVVWHGVGGLQAVHVAAWVVQLVSSSEELCGVSLCQDGCIAFSARAVVLKMLFCVMRGACAHHGTNSGVIIKGACTNRTACCLAALQGPSADLDLPQGGQESAGGQHVHFFSLSASSSAPPADELTHTCCDILPGLPAAYAKCSVTCCCR